MGRGHFVKGSTMKTANIMAVLFAFCLPVFAETFSGTLLVRPDWTHEKVSTSTAYEKFTALFNWAFTSGHSTNQMNQLWVARRSLASGASSVFNLAGAVTNSFGTKLTMDEVRLMAVSLPSSNLNTLVIGGATNNTFAAWTGAANDTVTIRPGGFFLLVGPDATGYVVSSNGNLKFANGGTNTITFDIWIGASDQ